mgnify:CR=1 FL=1
MPQKVDEWFASGLQPLAFPLDRLHPYERQLPLVGALLVWFYLYRDFSLISGPAKLMSFWSVRLRLVNQTRLVSEGSNREGSNREGISCTSLFFPLELL